MPLYAAARAGHAGVLRVSLRSDDDLFDEIFEEVVNAFLRGPQNWRVKSTVYFARGDWMWLNFIRPEHLEHGTQEWRNAISTQVRLAVESLPKG